ncbi:hypothetical protein V502_10049, partial [Pseudogymnoascus sp. VKM F-4520 (FW-2644)]
QRSCSNGKFTELYHFDAKADVVPGNINEKYPSLAKKMSSIVGQNQLVLKASSSPEASPIQFHGRSKRAANVSNDREIFRLHQVFVTWK